MPFTFQSDADFIKFVTLKKLPGWQTSLFKKYSDSIQVHSQGEIFYKLDTLFPNEHPASKEHRIKSFESVTEASFGRAANNVNRIFKNSSFTVEASDEVIEWATGHNFEGNNFYTWFLDEWTKHALKLDPNSIAVMYPPEYVKEENRKEVVFVSSCHIRHIDSEVVIFLSEEESDVEYSLSETQVVAEKFFDQSINKFNFRNVSKNTYTPKVEAKVKRHVYHVFVKGEGFYRIEQQKAKPTEWEMELFPIKTPFLPVMDAGGEEGSKGVNKSFLQPFVPFGNLALLQHSQHTAVNHTFSFPRMSEIETPCGECTQGKVPCETEADIQMFGEMKNCGICGGSGFTVNQTPYKSYRKRWNPNLDSDSKHLEIDDVKYYTPDTGILDYSKNEWKGYLDMAETAVYIQQRVSTGNVESAKSKEIDRDDLYSFLHRVGQVYFQRLRFMLQCRENYLTTSPIEVTVQIPYSYAILTESEAFDALKDILSSNVPVMLKASQVEGFVSKFVSQSSPIRKFLEVLKLVDPLLYYTTNEITGFKLAGIVTPELYVIHVFAYHTLQTMYLKDKNLFMQDPDAIATKLTTELDKYAPEPVEDLKTQIIKGLSGSAG